MTRPVILFAPGAGAPSSSPWMTRYVEYLQRLGAVATFDYPYRSAGRKLPDPLPKLIAHHSQELERVRLVDAPLVLAGKSMGARIGCHVALGHHVDALICFGYPLRAAGSGKLRDSVLLKLTTPILFIQGDRDPLCPPALLEQTMQRMSAKADLVLIPGADHSLEVGRGELKRTQTTQQAVEERIFSAVMTFWQKTGQRTESKFAKNS